MIHVYPNPADQVYPNPVDQELTINFTGLSYAGNDLVDNVSNTTNTEFDYSGENQNQHVVTYAPGATKEVLIYNDKLEIVYKNTTQEEQLLVSTASLPPGLYYLHIIFGEETVRRQIVVSRK